MVNTEEQSRFTAQLNNSSSTTASEAHVFVPISELERSSRKDEEASNNKHWRKSNLFLEIPARTMDITHLDFVQIKMPPTPTPTPTPKRVNFQVPPSPSNARLNASPGPASARGKSSIKNLLPKISFMNRGANSDIEKATNTDSSSSNVSAQDKLLISRSWSFSKMFTPRMKRPPSLPVTPRVKQTSSLPVTPIGNPNPDSVRGGSTNNRLTNNIKEVRGISRSLSVPDINSEEKGLRKVDSFFRVVPTPRPKNGESEVSLTETGDNETKEVDGEDIPKEEAVCRICMDELSEGGETLKLECSCKGELQLAHEECALKWFSIKGNRTCDVCGQEVQNLSVTLLRIESSVNRNSIARNFGQMEINGYRVWQDVPILVIVSMLAYFCFLEQLLVEKMGANAIAISLPFSCVLGLLSSMTSSTMVKRRFVWVYASVQFALVVLFAHIFYNLVHVQAVISILLSTFGGFGFAMSGSSIVVEILRWRRRRAISNQNDQIMLNHSLRPAPPSQIESPSYATHQLHPREVEDLETFSGR